MTTTLTSGPTTTGGRPRPAARRRRIPSWDRISFMAVFLGLPLAIFVVSVIYPFGPHPRKGRERNKPAPTPAPAPAATASAA